MERIPLKRLPKRFPFRAVFNDALNEYKRCRTYWYIPKALVLNNENVNICARTLRILFDEFLGSTWNRETQDALRSKLIDHGIQKPTAENPTRGDRTAISRITNRLLGTLGFLWAESDQEIIITDAGCALIEALENGSNPRLIVEGQVAKLQYPHPLVPASYRSEFGGILPHLFLLQILQETDYYLSFDEYELFVNLACEQGDVSRIRRYIMHWRDLNEEDAETLRNVFKSVPMKEDPSSFRFTRIHLNSSYQRSFYCYPTYLSVNSRKRTIRCHEAETTSVMIQKQLNGLKITNFENPEDWFAYIGDPEQRPSWFTYLTLAVQAADSKQEMGSELERHRGMLSEEETDEIGRLEIEKAIELSYVEHPGLLNTLEQGLKLEGRQVATPVGRIDLLCRGQDGKYVVVEIKALDAKDSVFGQILRYMGWIHRNYNDGWDNVRGIVLARQFSDKARYSRIGMLKPNCEEFMKFCRHAYATEEV